MGRPVTPIENRFWPKVDVRGVDDCWIWLSTLHPQGYGTIWDNDRQLQKRAHRLSWEIHYGSIPIDAVVRHLCHNTSCVNPAHLAIGTAADNGRDQLTNPNRPHGETHGVAKLSNEDVLRIRSLRGAQSQSSIAKEYDVTQALISHIQTRRIWRHLP